MKDNSNALSLTFNEFCHIRNVITRAELETLLFDEKLYTEVAQGKVNEIEKKKNKKFEFISFKNYDCFSYVLIVVKCILIY